MVLAAETHWSLQPMKKTVIADKGHPIDFFIGQKLVQEKLLGKYYPNF